MNSTVEQRAIKNTIVGIISFIISFLQTILIVPLILTSWGPEKYGNWIALFAAFTLLQTLDLGHQSFIANEINVLYHKSKQELQKVLSSSLQVAWLIGFIELLITLSIIFSGNLSVLLGLDPTVFELAYSLLALIIMWFIFGSVSGILIRLLVPVGKFYELQWISLIIKFAQFIVLLVIVLLNGSILTAAISYSIVQSILTIFTLLYLKKVLPEFYPWWLNGNFKVSFKNFFRSIFLTVNTIIQQLSVNGLILFVSNFYQVIQVPVFTTIRTLTNTAGSFTNIIISSVNPDIVKYYSRGEDRKLFLSLKTNLFLSGMLVNITLVISLLFIGQLYKIWTNNQLIFSHSLFLFLAAGLAFSNFGIGFVNYFFGVNKLKQFTYINFSKSITLFIIAYLLIGYDDLATIGLSIAVSELFSSVIIPIYFMKLDKPELFRGKNILFFSLSIIPPILISILALLNYFSFYSIFIVLLILVFMFVIYYLIWKMIDVEVKSRLKTMIKKNK